MSVAVMVTSGKQTALLTKSFSFEVVQILSASPDYDTTGSAFVVLFAASLMPTSSSQSARTSGSAAESSNWRADSSILVKRPSGTRSNFHMFGISVVQSVSSYSFANIRSSAISSLNSQSKLPVTGGSLLLFLGFGFGYASSTASSKLTGSSAPVCDWVSSSSVFAKIPHGYAQRAGVVLSIDGLPTSAWSDIPSATGTAIVSSQPTAGNATEFSSIPILLSGAGFGTVETSLQIKVYTTSCGASTWTSDSAASCRIDRQSKCSLPVTLSISSIQTARISTCCIMFDAGCITNVAPRELLSTGAALITLSGLNFVQTECASIRIGSSSLTGSVWLSATTVWSRGAAGTGTFLPVIISLSESFVFESGDVLFASYNSPSVFRSNEIAPTSASTSILIAGFQFGTKSASPQTHMHVSSHEATTWSSDSSLQPRIIVGVGIMTGVTVTSFLQIGITNSSIQYGVVRGVDTFSGYFPVTSKLIVNVQTLVGLGTMDTSCKMRAGKSAAQWTLWISDSSLNGRVSSGVGAGRMIGNFGITVQRQTGNNISSALSYNAASLISVSPGNVATSGGMSTTVIGTGFGVQGFSGRLRASMNSNPTAFEGSFWRSDSSLSGRTASGHGAASILFATIDSQLGTRTNLLSYNTVFLTATSIGNAAASGSVSLTVLGKAYGVSGFSGRLLVSMVLSARAATAFECSDWRSDSCLSGRVGNGVGAATVIVFVTVGRFSGSMTSALSYNAASLTSAIPSTAAASGSLSVTMFGTNFGVFGFSGRLRISMAFSSNSATACQSSLWRSETSLLGRWTSGASGVAAGFSGGIAFATIGMQRGMMTNALSYNADSLSATSSCNVAASSSLSITMFGISFGLSGFSGRLRISMAFSSNSATACQSSLWRSETSLLGRSASGVGAGSSGGIAFATIGRHIVILTNALSYNAASLSAISPCNVAVSGSISATVYGRAFGVSGFSGRLRTSMASSSNSVTDAESSAWKSDSSLLGRFASGAGAAFGVANLIATVGRQFGCISSALSYNTAVLTAINPCNAAASGSTPLAILGRGFGATGFIKTVRAGVQSSGASVHAWRSDSSTSMRPT
jgi:hypothetical protein